mmetsp:Transcript_61116/g.170963  ORF Transcript_61116/g.170963 Transcript_61116/m.170963 type:complete len:346 (-) Transcript_61116:29-1066(-)
MRDCFRGTSARHGFTYIFVAMDVLLLPPFLGAAPGPREAEFPKRHAHAPACQFGDIARRPREAEFPERHAHAPACQFGDIARWRCGASADAPPSSRGRRGVPCGRRAPRPKAPHDPPAQPRRARGERCSHGEVSRALSNASSLSDKIPLKSKLRICCSIPAVVSIEAESKKMHKARHASRPSPLPAFNTLVRAPASHVRTSMLYSWDAACPSSGVKSTCAIGRTPPSASSISFANPGTLAEAYERITNDQSGHFVCDPSNVLGLPSICMLSAGAGTCDDVAACAVAVGCAGPYPALRTAAVSSASSRVSSCAFCATSVLNTSSRDCGCVSVPLMGRRAHATTIDE